MVDQSIPEMIRSGPRYSEARKIEGHKFVWRLLDTWETDRARTWAQGQVYRNLLDQVQDKTAALDLCGSTASLDSQTDWTDCYCLAEAMTHEADKAPLFAKADPGEAAKEVADTFSTIQRAKLIDNYIEFVEEIEPELSTTAQEDELVDAVKKNPETASLKAYGSNTLRKCLVTLARQLSEAEIQVSLLRESKPLEELQYLEIVERLDRLESATDKSTDGT